MIVTREWLEKGEHCPGGLAYALSVLPPQGLELEKCWPLLHRPDWVISLAVQSHHIAISEARHILWKIILSQDPWVNGYLEHGGDERLWELVGTISERAYEEFKAGRDGRGHFLNAAVQVLKSDKTPKSEPGAALRLLQGAAFSLGLAGRMVDVADKIKTAIGAL